MFFWILVMAALACSAGSFGQTDWSGGPGQTDLMESFGTNFESAENVSWLAVSGQVVLSSRPLTTAIRTELASEGERGAYGLASADVDGDGDIDIFGTSDSQSGILLWLNQGGDPPVLERRVIDSDFAGGTSLHPIDIDLDGDLDLVGAAQRPGNRVAWWRNDQNDAEWPRFSIDDLFPVACNVSAADIDGNGWPDVVSTSWSTSRLNVWYSSGGDPIEWTEQTVAFGLRGAHSAVAGDVDGDGDLDVVGTGANDKEVLLLENLGGNPPQWNTEVIGDDLDGVRYSALHDLDGDLRLDIVAAAADGQVIWWSNPAVAGDWTRHVIDEGCLGGHWIDVADVDGDGREDIVVAAYGVGQYFWYRNEGGSGDDWTRFAVEDQGFESPLTVIAADIDGRGDLELIGAEWEPGLFYWWEVSEFEPSGQLVSSSVDLGAGARSVRLSWDATEPDGTHLNIEVRSGLDQQTLGDWTEVAQKGSSMELEGPVLQYRVNLATSDPALSPILRSVTVERRLQVAESAGSEGADASPW